MIITQGTSSKERLQFHTSHLKKVLYLLAEGRILWISQEFLNSTYFSKKVWRLASEKTVRGGYFECFQMNQLNSDAA